MKLLKDIFARIWALWGIITFVITFLIFLIPSLLTYLIPDPRGSAIFIFIARIWMRIWLTLVGCPVTVYGKEYFEKGKTYVVTYNHNSLMDPPLSCPFVPGANRTIAKVSFAKVPLFGWYYRRGSVLVDRNNEISRRKSFEEMKKVLRTGMHMCIYPEGTRNRTEMPLKKFYDGAFKLAIESGHDVIPALLFNTRKALPPERSFYFLPKKLSIHFLSPVTVAGKTTEELKNEVFLAMQEFYLKHNNQ